MTLDQRNEVLGRVAGERALGKVRVLAEEIQRCGVQVGEVASAAAADEDLASGALARLKQQHAKTARTSQRSTEHTSGASAQNDNVERFCCRHTSSILESMQLK